MIAFTSWQKEDIDLRLECEVEGLLLDYIGNPWQGKTLWNMEPDNLIRRALEVISYAKEQEPTLPSLYETTSRYHDFLEKHYKTIVGEAHVDSVTITDTYGCALP